MTDFIRRLFIILSITFSSHILYAQNTPLLTDYDVVILGAGPAGLAAALAANQLGAKTLIVEKRNFNTHLLPELKNSLHGNFLLPPQEIKNKENYRPWATRSRIVSVDENAFNIAKKLGANIPKTDINNFSIFHGKQGRNLSIIPRTERSTKITKSLLKRKMQGSTSIEKIEQFLFQAIADTDIKIIFDSKLVTKNKSQIQLAISSENSQSKKLDLNAKFLIISEGAHSSTLEMLNTRRVDLGFPQAQWIVSNFKSDQPSKYNLRTQFGYNAGSPYFSLVLTDGLYSTIYASPHKQTPESWQYTKDHADKIILEAARNMGIQGRFLQDTAIFTSVIDRTKSFFIEGNTLVIGDAARKADPGSGFGITSAIEDSLRIKEFLSAALSQKPFQQQTMDKAIDKFQTAMMDSAKKVAKQASYFHSLRSLVKSKVGRLPISLFLNIWRKMTNGEKKKVSLCMKALQTNL